MAFSATLSQLSSFHHLSPLPQTTRRHPSRLPWIEPIKAAAAEPEKSKPSSTQTKTEDSTTTAKTQPSSSSSVTKIPKKPVFSMKKGEIVRVDKDKYLNSINYLSVGHPPYYKGLDYIYEDRGEVLDVRNFETGEYALIAWVGIPTAPAWLPTNMLIKTNERSSMIFLFIWSAVREAEL
ncbi:NAD(P)H-quinone oxidoreductase subunit O, chloroplastic isoform X2 [Carica papaya]|uniref:NAD(P)H-quinone oxidoreductase subunit O, chloroplastic isoform X2 n=1 Tax=Carica papaya TaxID=3649 RepID=UPI000B8C90DE|nr:NAD(P)H-quinone oxidoreductase subunit O, chloroplastic isoform X2 [Carica papaya]